MKIMVRVFLTMALMVFANSVSANDQDNLSKALEKGKDVYCNNIKDSDLKNYCQGIVKKQSIYCNNIRASKLKKECKAKAK